MASLSPARACALRVGAAARARDAFVDDLLDADEELSGMEAPDRAFAVLLARGVAATWGTLDECIDATLRSSSQVKPDVRDALRVSAYELLFLGKQAHAAVDQGVQLVRSVQPRATGVANHVLRRLSERAGCFPFGDVETDDEALARRCGFPLWLCKRLVAQMGRAQAAQFMEASNQPAPVYVGVNACKLADAAFEDELASYGVQARQMRLGPDAAPIAGCWQLRDGSAIAGEPLCAMLADGQALVADASAQAIAALALPNIDSLGSTPLSMLEIGAGRGTKTVLLQAQAARRFGQPMQLVCVDNLGFKAGVLRKRAQLCQVPLDDVVVADARKPLAKLEGRTFNAVLVDAPCSGLGTLRRHPEIRWRLQQADVEALAADGLAMLQQASAHVAPGGRVTYSTCTVTPEENEGVVKAFLESEAGEAFDIAPIDTPEGRRLTFSTVLAPGGPDAHFACILHRR